MTYEFSREEEIDAERYSIETWKKQVHNTFTQEQIKNAFIAGIAYAKEHSNTDKNYYRILDQIVLDWLDYKKTGDKETFADRMDANGEDANNCL